MENNTQTQSPYISLDFCSCQKDFSQIPITRRDLGNTGTFINYSMVIAEGPAQVSYWLNIWIRKGFQKG